MTITADRHQADTIAHAPRKASTRRKGWFNPAPDDQGYKPVLPVETKEEIK